MATSKRKPKRPAPAPRGIKSVSRRVPFTKLRGLLGKPIDDPAAKRVLAAAGTVFVPKIARGQLLVARDAGFDLSLSPRDGKRGAPLLVSSIVLYRDGVATPDCPPRSREDYVHRQYSDPPFALRFVARRELLSKMPTPRETWLWGTGPVAVDAPLVSYDEWSLDGLDVRVSYTISVRSPAAGADDAVEHIHISSD